MLLHCIKYIKGMCLIHLMPSIFVCSDPQLYKALEHKDFNHKD